MSLVKFLTFTLSIALSAVAFANFSSKKDGEFVTLSGKVKNVKADSFQLMNGNRTILIEMDDNDWDADGYKLVNGDEVVVSGVVDQDFLEKKKIEAGSVYVKSLNTYFYASSMDEEGAAYLSPTYSTFATLPENATVEMTGKVISVSGREFVIYTGLRNVTVDTDSLIYNPMDKIGFTKIKKGDRVTVTGKVDDNIFGKRKVNASSLYELKNNQVFAE